MFSLCLNSLPLQPSSYPKKLTETYLSSSSFSNGSIGTALKPIVVSGNPPTFVSAPGRRIVAGYFSFNFVVFLVTTPCKFMFNFMLKFSGLF